MNEQTLYLVDTASGREFFETRERAIQGLVNHSLAHGGGSLYAGGLRLLDCDENGKLTSVED